MQKHGLSEITLTCLEQVEIEGGEGEQSTQARIEDSESKT